MLKAILANVLKGNLPVLQVIREYGWCDEDVTWHLWITWHYSRDLLNQGDTPWPFLDPDIPF